MTLRKENHTELILMRHGATVANEAHIFCGKLDPPLSAQGEAQTRFAAKILGGGFDRVLTSPALRALQTARIVCPDIKAEVLPALREIDFGEFEGLTADEIQVRMPDAWVRYMADPLRFTFPGGDDADDYLRNAAETAHHLGQEGGRLLVVSHKGFVTAALSCWLCGDASAIFHYDIAPAGSAELGIIGDFAVLKQLR